MIELKELNRSTIWTDYGIIQKNKWATGDEKLNIAEYALGDKDYEVVGDETSLKNEVYRNKVTHVTIDPNDKKAIRVGISIPPGDGGFIASEIGLFDVDGGLLAIGTFTPVNIPVEQKNEVNTVSYTLTMKTSNTDAFEIKIDPNIEATLHIKESVTSEEGVHDFRVDEDGKAWYGQGDDWEGVKSGSHFIKGDDGWLYSAITSAKQQLPTFNEKIQKKFNRLHSKQSVITSDALYLADQDDGNYRSLYKIEADSQGRNIITGKEKYMVETLSMNTNGFLVMELDRFIYHLSKSNLDVLQMCEKPHNPSGKFTGGPCHNKDFHFNIYVERMKRTLEFEKRNIKSLEIVDSFILDIPYGQPTIRYINEYIIILTSKGTLLKMNPETLEYEVANLEHIADNAIDQESIVGLIDNNLYIHCRTNLEGDYYNTIITVDFNTLDDIGMTIIREHNTIYTDIKHQYENYLYLIGYEKDKYGQTKSNNFITRFNLTTQTMDHGFSIGKSNNVNSNDLLMDIDNSCLCVLSYFRNWENDDKLYNTYNRYQLNDIEYMYNLDGLIREEKINE